jgi:hypothetical protein
MAVDVDLSETTHVSLQAVERLAALTRSVTHEAEEILARPPSAQKAGDFQELCRDYAVQLQDVATKLSQAAVALKARA